MSWEPSMAELQGLSLETAEKFGKPCVGAYYQGKGIHTNRLEEDARCCVCGHLATNSHHDPAIGMGGGKKVFRLNGHALKPALFALCGSGSMGCHSKVHQGLIRIRWEWDSEKSRQYWFEGKYPEGWYDHSPHMYAFGRWVIADRDGKTIKEIRRI